MNQNLNPLLSEKLRNSLNIPGYIDKYNIIVMGDAKVGKTTVLNNLMEIKVKPFFRVIDNEINTKDILENITLEYIPAKKEKYLFKIWNYCYISEKSLINDFMAKADAFIIIYSVTDKESFENIEKWIKQARNNANCKNVSFFIIGNKFNLENKIQVGEGEIIRLEKQLNCKFFRISSVSVNDELNKIFSEILYDIVNVNYSEMDTDELTSDNEKRNKRGKCNICFCILFFIIIIFLGIIIYLKFIKKKI